MTDRTPETLTADGVTRREAMLNELLGAVERTRRRRRLRRRMTAGAGCAALGLCLIRIFVSTPPSLPEGPRIVVDSAPTQSSGPAAPVVPRWSTDIRIVQTRPEVMEQYRAKPTGRTTRLDDAMLIETLASIHRPAGLIHFGDQVRLSAPVTDEELNLQQ